MPKTRTLEEYTNATAQKMPEGKLYNAKDIENSNLRDLLKGLSQEFVYVNDKLNEILNEHDPRITTKFIGEWEKALGIPDDCIKVAETLEERRLNILLKIKASGLTTKQDYIDLAELAGLEIEIEHLIDIGAWIWTWPHIWGASTTKEGKFTLVITFLNIKLPGA